MPETIFLVAPSQHVVAVTRDVPVPATLSEILGALLEGPTTAESVVRAPELPVRHTAQVRGHVASGIATVDFIAANPVQVVGPDQTLAIAQVVFTATQQPGVTGVVFKIDNQPIEVPTASGAQVPGPVKPRLLPAPGAAALTGPGRQDRVGLRPLDPGGVEPECSRS